MITSSSPLTCAALPASVPVGSAPTWAAMQQPLRDRPGAGARTSLSVLRSNAAVERTVQNNPFSNQVGRVPARLTVLGLPSGVGTGSQPNGIGGPSTVRLLTNHILRPRMADRTSHRSEDFVGRPALITRRHVEQLEEHSDALDDYSALLEEVMEDGRVDAAEQRLLLIRFDAIQCDGRELEDDGQLINESVTFSDRLMHGDGARAPWFRQMAREYVRDQSRLRLVVDNTDGPEPGAPGAAQPAKRKPRDEGNRQAA